MKLSYIGHACFLVESDTGTRVLMDPYQPGAFRGQIGLLPFLERVDCITSSHEHIDHFHLDPAFGNPIVVRDSAEAVGLRFFALDLPHGSPDGVSRFRVKGIRFEMDGITVFHPGDIGRVLTRQEIQALGRVDLLLLPVGGKFTIGPVEAVKLIELLKPAIAVPMHFQSHAVTLPMAPLSVFLAKCPQYEKVDVQPLVISANDLPSSTRIVVLDALNAPRK